MKTLDQQSGITLTELLVSLSVIVILMTLSVPSFSGFIDKRTVAGSTNLIGAYFENVRMESAKRNSWITITFRKHADGVNWCFGAEKGKNQTCDCLEAAETTDCRLAAGDKPMILSNTSDPGFSQLQITAALTDNDHFHINPVRGTFSHSDKLVIQVKNKAEDFLVNVAVTPTGRVSKCSPTEYKLVGFPTCI